MKAEKIYLLPVNGIKKAASVRFFRMLFMAGLLLMTMPAMAQYYNVTHLTGTNTVGGVNVTVTNFNGSTATNCGYGPYKEGNGGPGSYTWTFGTPIVAVRAHITAIGPSDVVSISINGVAYPVSSFQVGALPVACGLDNTAIAVGGVIVTSGGNSDCTLDIYTGSPINSVTIASSGLSGVVASDFNFEPVLNNVPMFVNGASVTIPVCQDAAPMDISSSLAINDADNLQTETWTITSGPANGTLNGFPASMTSNGSIVTPGAGTFTYQPMGGFSGADSFIVRINDGTDTADIMVHMTVNPTPNVVVSSSQTKCNMAATDSVYFLGSVSGTTFNWGNDNNSTGLASTGMGDIPSFTAVDTSVFPPFVSVISTVTVTPTANTCVGTAQLFTITVNPTPDVYVPADMTACNGSAVPMSTYSSDATGTTYTWVNDNSSIGLATSGTTNILSFTGQNTGTADNIGNITVTPTAAGCVGGPQSYMITIYPTPMLTSPLANLTCDSTQFNYTPNSLTTGVSYNWDRAIVSGLNNMIASGSGGVSEYLDNNGTTLATAIYTYTLTANGCSNVQNVADTVVPTLLLTSPLVASSVCNNTVFSYTPTSATPGVTFQWNRNPVYGISNNGSTNSFNPLETLDDTITIPVVVTYNYNVIYSSCVGAHDVKVTVNPTAKLTTSLTPPAVCDSTLFTYGSASSTAGTTFSWSRATNPDISNNPASGVDTIKEYLVNTATFPVQVTYVDTLTAYGCQSTQLVKVYVNPSAVLSGNTSPRVCSNTPFDYIPASATLGTTYAWSRAKVTGISNAAASDTGSIHETLINTTADTIVVLYIDTLTVNTCKNTDTIRLVVKPTPRLSSNKAPAAICNKTTFNYTPLSATVGSSFDWSRPFILGIDLIAGNGTNNPNEQLVNTTYFDVAVAYVYTLTANGCVYNNDTVVVKVHPSPVLSSEDTVVTCSHAPFTYMPTSNTPLTTFKWTRAKVNGILPSVAADSFTIHETLVDTADFAIYTTYKYKLNIGGCVDSQNLTVRVDPATFTPSIAIMPKGDLCSATHYQNFGAATAPPAGSSYTWSAINASVMATGNNKQNSLVSFNTAGTAKVILTSSIAVTGCRMADTVAVNVGSGVSDNPNVIYYNGQFMCLQNGVKTYQWGYDDAITLDSTLYSGEINQVYFNNAPDYTYKYYWVMTTNANGCMQKSYYNVPAGVVNVNTNAVSMKVYPNPASANINVEINTTLTGDIQVEVINLMGQKVTAEQAVDHKATINVAQFASGMYLVNCYSDGVKVATTKFIKN